VFVAHVTSTVVTLLPATVPEPVPGVTVHVWVTGFVGLVTTATL